MTWTVKRRVGAMLLGVIVATAPAAAAPETGREGKTAGAVSQTSGSTQGTGAGEDGDPQVTTATYQDWLVRCVAPPSKAKLCEATQTIQVQGQSGQPGGPIAVLALGRLAADAPLRVAVQLPAGVWLPAGAKLQVSEKAKPAGLEFKRCLQGCFAEVEADRELELSLRTASGNGSLTFEDGTRRAVSVPISFRGFAAALDAALKGR